MLKLICGVSGSGKTDTLIAEIRKDIAQKTRCYLLVPEQQAYISERDMTAALPSDAGLYFEVVNFSSLAEDVFREYGGVTQGTLSTAVRNLLMWDTLRTLAPLLKQYGKSATADPSLSRLMMQTVNELRMNGIDSQKMEDAAQLMSPDSALQKKLFDLALIDAVFHEKNESVFGNDPSDKLLRMAALLEEKNYLKGCHIYVDSFTSFTAQEYAVLRHILRQAEHVTVTLCADSFSSKLPQFEGTLETAKRLAKLAAEVNVETERIMLCPKSEQRKAALAALERHIWTFDLPSDGRVALSEEEQRAVRIVSCSNLYEETEAAALHILELVQGGMHYGDIAVVVRDTETYRGVLDAALERYGIPFFLSEPTDLSSKPLSRLILSALRAVSRHYHVQDVMTLVKTGLAGVSFKDAALFEEYCETWHLSGSRFTDSHWSMNPDGLTTDRSARADEILAAANRVRKQIMEPLERLSLDLHAAKSTHDQCRAIYDYLARLNISAQLSDYARRELAAGARREANEALRLYRFLIDTLVTLAEALPDAELTVDELFSVLSLLFADSQLSSVPNAHDCVIIGSASTLRVENIKASLLLGLCEGEFPRAQSDDGVFSESDKVQMESIGLSLDSREKIRASEELLYVYRAITKPRESLYVSTVEMQIDGSQRTPSLAFNRICYLLDRKPIHFDAARLRQILGQVQLSDWKPKLTAKEQTASNITLRLSQSKIRTFALCPFSYFSNYRLKLREKKDSRPSYSDDGVFLHYIFEKVLCAMLGSDGQLHLLPMSEVESLATRVVDDYIAQVCPLPPEHMDARLLHLFARLRRVALLMLREILDELRASSFVPSRFEQRIGDEVGGLPTVALELKNGARVILDGMVDRIDLFEHDGHVFVRVVDYKSGEHKFSIDEVRSGLDIQLVLYLYAICSSDSEKYAPVGAQFLYAKTEKGQVSVNRSGFVLDDEALKPHIDASTEQTYTKKLSSLTNEKINDLMQDMQDAVREIAERILAGDAQKTPSEEACRFCAVRSHCDQAYRNGRR